MCTGQAGQPTHRVLCNFDGGSVPGAQDQGAIHLELHVGGARGLRARSADVLRQLSACRSTAMSIMSLVSVG